MTSILAKYISKKILGESVKNNFGKEDPYFESVPATRLDGRPSGKAKKRRKALPAGISEHDGKVLTKVKRRAYRLDMSLFNFCGIRFGWSSVIGIIPGFGDVIDAFMAIMVLRTCQQVEGGLPSDVKTKMVLNIIIDFGLGLLPILGDILDAVYRANTKNAVVLEKYLRDKGVKALKAQGQSLPAVDPSDPDEFDRQEEAGPTPPRYTSAPPSRQGTQRQGNGHNSEMRRPEKARVAEEKRGGWFAGLGGKSKVQDAERGEMGPYNEEYARDDGPRRHKSTLQKNKLGR